MSREAWGDPPDPEPSFCPLCGETNHVDGCELGDMQQRALAAEAEVRRLSRPASLTQRLQQRCSDWGAYWRASDAHGVQLTVEQATELLMDALGVEVEIGAHEAPAAEPAPQQENSHEA